MFRPEDRVFNEKHNGRMALCLDRPIFLFSKAVNPNLLQEALLTLTFHLNGATHSKIAVNKVLTTKERE